MIQGNFKILFNKQAGPEYFRMRISAPDIARRAIPGQFVHLRCANASDPLLRRPFSFHRIGEDTFEVLYKVIGRGTNLLAKKRKGDKIDVLGPLGNGFDYRVPFVGYQFPASVLVAGGMGVAPLFALAEKMVHGENKTVYVLIGATAKKHILCEKEFSRLGLEVLTATDDGSKGHKGVVTDLLKKFLHSTANCELTTVYACGPKPMLEAVALISRRYRVTAQGSLEENMACGVGACCGCAVETKEGYRQVCNDGPVFNLREIKW